MQMIVLAISLILMAVVALVFISAVRATDAAPAEGSPEGKRQMLIWLMLIFGAVVTVASLYQWPHAIAKSSDVITVNASGGQFFWEFDRESVPVGKPVVFNVQTQDVTHGLGIVDPDGTLLFQTQAMPGYINQVEYVFTKPGTYRVLCMEYCGLAHHGMNSELTVTSN